jgi:hypothetical protein
MRSLITDGFFYVLSLIIFKDENFTGRFSQVRDGAITCNCNLLIARKTLPIDTRRLGNPQARSRE